MVEDFSGVFEHGSLGAAAIRIMEDYAQYDMRAANRYTLQQALYTIIEEKRSIVSMKNNVPSYVWWYIGMDDGEPVISFRSWSLANMVAHAPRTRKKRGESYRLVPFVYRNEEAGSMEALWGLSDHENDLADIMLRKGYHFGQDYLSRLVVAVRGETDYFGEYDESYEVSNEVIYAARRQTDLVLIPFGLRRSFTKSIRVQE